MSCSCVYVDSADSVAEACRETVVRAVKPVRCDECGREIRPLEKYEKFLGLWGRSWDRYNTWKIISIRTWLTLTAWRS
jgi:hypothetical protein